MSGRPSRLAASEREWTKADVLDRLAIELAEDRAALQDVMAAMDVSVRASKTWAGWTAERMGRLKLNGRVFRRSPLSRVLELEAMRLGVEGKAAGGGPCGPARPQTVAWMPTDSPPDRSGPSPDRHVGAIAY